MEENVLRQGMHMRSAETVSNEEWLPTIVSIEMQEFGDTYDVETALNCGTVFPALNKPFTGGM